MEATALDDEWVVVRDLLLPRGWRDLARSSGAFQRARGVADPESLLRVLLLHIGGGLSLRQTVVRARELGLGSISDVALLKRLRAAEPWLRELTQAMCDRPRSRPALSPRWRGRRIRVVDATTVEEAGATGTTWRVHFSLQLPSLACDFFEVTGPEGGECFQRLDARAGDVVLGDRGYSHREGVAHLTKLGAKTVVRLAHAGFPLLTRRGAPFDLFGSLRKLVKQSSGAWRVSFESSEGLQNARLCAIRKSPLAATRAKERTLRRAQKKGKKIRPSTLEAAEYVLVLTTLDEREASTDDVLELYRARWQVELAFKRLKSLLGAGHVPKHDPVSARAWLYGKLLVALLLDRLIEEAGFFSPWGLAVAASDEVA
jgi:hypothetical protein